MMNLVKYILVLIILFLPITGLKAACDCASVDAGEPCSGNFVEYTRTGGEFRNRDSFYNITDTLVRFEFDCDGGECLCGQFANGRDYWVAPRAEGDTVRITRISPDAYGSGESFRNGSVLAPSNRDSIQGYDGRTSAGSKFGIYDSGLSLSFPVEINAQDHSGSAAVIKAVSTKQEDNCSSWGRVCLDQLEVLTVLSEAPGDVFRPAYFGREKNMYHADLFDASILSNLQPLEDNTTWDEALETMMGIRAAVHLDNQNHRQGFSAVLNYFPPGGNTRGYAGYVGQYIQRALIKLTEDAQAEDLEKKVRLARYITQYGIDLWSVFNSPDDGDPCGHWEANGGFNNNYLAPILFASELLGQNWSEQINQVMSTDNGKNCFAETGFVQPESVTSPGKAVPLFGTIETNLGIEDYTCSTNSNNINSNFLTDGLGRGKNSQGVCVDEGSGCPTPYMSCCTHGHWLASAMSIWLTPSVYDSFPENAKHWLDYVDRARAMGVSVGTDFGAYCDQSSLSVTGFDSAYDSDISYNMWDEYRECSKTQSCIGMTQATNNVLAIRADVNQDSSINSSDALLVLRRALNRSMSGTAWQASVSTGDVNCDGLVSTVDALLTLREHLGLDNSGSGWCGG